MTRMRKRWLYPLAVSVVSLIVSPAFADDTIREPAVAGQFYPSNPGELKATVTALLADSQKRIDGKPYVLVCPHAGYPYSGKVAAAAFKQAADNDYDLIIVLGTNHTTGGFNKAAVV